MSHLKTLLQSHPMCRLRTPTVLIHRVAGYCLAALMVSGTGLAQYGVLPSGTHVTSLAKPETRAVALFFVASDCPISNRTFPEMRRVRDEFRSQGVAFWFVYPNRTEQVAQVEKHQREFDPGGDVLLDPAGELVRLSGARVTPEISVLIPASSGTWRPIYTGRIDDRFVRLGLERQQVTEHFGEAALKAVVGGKPVAIANGTPVGCGIIPGGGTR